MVEGSSTLNARLIHLVFKVVSNNVMCFRVAKRKAV